MLDGRKLYSFHRLYCACQYQSQIIVLARPASRRRVRWSVFERKCICVSSNVLWTGKVIYTRHFNTVLCEENGPHSVSLALSLLQCFESIRLVLSMIHLSVFSLHCVTYFVCSPRCVCVCICVCVCVCVCLEIPEDPQTAEVYYYMDGFESCTDEEEEEREEGDTVTSETLCHTYGQVSVCLCMRPRVCLYECVSVYASSGAT